MARCIGVSYSAVVIKTKRLMKTSSTCTASPVPSVHQSRGWFFIIAGIVVLLALRSYGIEPSVVQLHPPSSQKLGESGLAMTDKWILVGEPRNDDQGGDSGAVQVFDRVTGKWLRKLKPNIGAANARFGWSIAVRGNLALIGAYQDGTQGAFAGAAYVFDVSTGKQLFKLVASDGDASSFFGTSVAISGNLGVIGSPSHDDPSAGSNAGAIYLFDLTTGAQLNKIPGTAMGEVLGSVVAASSRIIAAMD